MREIGRVDYLSFLDKRYEAIRNEYSIASDNKEFRYYESLMPLDFKSDNSFLCMKMEKTKILFCSDNTKTYLSDADIINTIVEMPSEIANQLIDKFIQLYNGKAERFSFKLSNKKFLGSGISYCSSFGSREMMLFSDNVITLNEFIFILNMIFEKDRLATVALNSNSLRKTLCKYVTLIMFYKYRTKSALQYLRKNDYPPNKDVYSVFSSPKKIRIHNQAFEDFELFERLKMNVV